MQHFTPADLAVLALELVPTVTFGLAGDCPARAAERWPRWLKILLPALCALPYVLVTVPHQMFSWRWLALYAALPVALAWLLTAAAAADPEQKGNWRDALILLALGVPVDLRWFESAWPNGLAGLGKLLLVDAGLYGFVVIRQLRGTGFDFHFRWRDWKTGLRELAFFAPIVIGLGLALGFLQPHPTALRPSMILTWAYIFVFVAVPEELFFRAWVQNLLEKRITAWLAHVSEIGRGEGMAGKATGGVPRTAGFGLGGRALEVAARSWFWVAQRFSAAISALFSSTALAAEGQQPDPQKPSMQQALTNHCSPRTAMIARRAALVIASVLFGLSHFNKRSPTFNWRYVILATIAGIFYGRAWRQDRRVPASAITHASVDAIWTLWF